MARKTGKSNNPAFKSATQDRRRRFNKVLRCYLQSNCASYTWARESLAHIERNDYRSLYSQAESLSTAVYGTWREHYAANQLAALILKYPFDWREMQFDLHPEANAIEKFYKSERKCKISNQRFKSNVVRGRFAPVMERAKVILENILGCEPDMDAIFDLCAFGPGSNVGVHGNATHVGAKYFAKTWTVTPTADPYFRAALSRHHEFLHSTLVRGGEYRTYTYGKVVCYESSGFNNGVTQRLKYVDCNKLSFVPKTAKTHRSIAIEPLGNSFVQTGIDNYMRGRLLTSGQDLKDQGRNQYLARVGSQTGDLCTIDLSSASDTISLGLVRYLLPSAWFSMLNATRSPSFVPPGRKADQGSVRYEKFTSMGNGFCFPLETAIFLSIVRACLEVKNLRHTPHSVYGDDIIVHRSAVDLVMASLRFAGFTPNKDKTFVRGPFRESCGADWYEGQDVRPVYLDYHLDSPESLRIFHNSTLRSDVTKEAFSRTRPLVRSFDDFRNRFLAPDSYFFQAHKDWWKGGLKHRVGSPSQEARKLTSNGAYIVPLDVFMSSRWAAWNRDEQRWGWKQYVFTPKVDTSFIGSVAQYWALLLGSPGGELHLRRETRRRIVNY